VLHTRKGKKKKKEEDSSNKYFRSKLAVDTNKSMFGRGGALLASVLLLVVVCNLQGKGVEGDLRLFYHV